MPSVNSRVCSEHFVGGKKSDNINDLAYIPTIFPAIYNKKVPNEQRAARLKARNERKQSLGPSSFQDNSFNFDNEECTYIEYEAGNFTRTESISIQTDPVFDMEDICKINYLYCGREQNEVSVQTEIYVSVPQRRKIIIPDKYLKQTKHARCGPDEPSNPGFIGFENINADSTMRQLAGVTISFFLVLLSLIEIGKYGQPNFYRSLGKKNRLLLFLMKLNLGISFCALGCLFQVHATTASRIFFQVLETLSIKTKTWIFWPSKSAVKQNLPTSFHNYPNCRCIIDCTEIPIDTPPTIEERVLTYSNYKGGFTNKFLIVITPDGFICKVSKADGGRATDAFITNDCNFLTLLEAGDEVLADKGFPQIRSELMKRNAILTIPPFAFNPQFTEEEVQSGYNIASVRIHVERAIQRVKVQGILRYISMDLINYIDQIMHMCCVIANSLPPLIKND
ncbi:uncharacterized protein [Prorops nasuta]|uniref:uncharacterized protein n=1 Tax=Prorops nasuta TaxID=863751 RepID=UPI0034CF0643